MTSLCVLVTGASGFLGSRLVRRLAREGHEVVALVRPGRGAALHGFDGRCVEQDLSRPWPGPHLGSLDAVVYLAQSAAYRDFPRSAPDLVAVGLQGAVQAADLATRLSARQFVFASSGSVYRPSFSPLAEESEIGPPDFYASTKACAEVLLAGYARYFELKVVRPFFVYGPGQAERMAVPRLMRRALARAAIVLEPGAGDDPDRETDGLRFSPIYADDAVECLARLLGVRGGLTVNVAGDEVVSMREVGMILGELTGAAPRFELAERPRQGDLVAANAALRRAVSPIAFTPVREGLRRVLDSMLEDRR